MNYALNSLTYSLSETLETAVQASLDEWKQHDKINRLWKKDATVWTNSDEAKWLAWLDVVGVELADLQKYRDFAEDVKQFESIVLLGMGGSSLCPEVLAITFGVKNFYVLDSTVPVQVKVVENKVDLAKTLFIVASKSGSTLEPNCFKQYFYERVVETVGRENAGKHFVAITDPGSKMQSVAERDGFRHIFFGNPEIGGRFSALSPFGMCALASMQLDVEGFLNCANAMVSACKNENPNENPGAVLGTILGIAHAEGRDKLTIITSDKIYDLGAWLEQLIAESTGKIGVSIIPIDREQVQNADTYGNDRVFVLLDVEDDFDDQETLATLKQLEENGHPVIRINLIDRRHLGQEFFRWEFATAVAGSLMKINPFNQPDVESAKIEARKITEEYEQTGELPKETPFFEADGIKLFSDEKNVAELNLLVGEKTLANYLQAHLNRIKENDYFALLGYIEMNDETESLLQKIRHSVLAEKGAATCLGFGPRFLHSTGQGYKGGANNGVFLQITSDDAIDFAVPEQKFTFGVVKSAQARGDFQVLVDRDRRALRVHLGADVSEGLKKIISILK
ncbi:MAG TPA: bifunctional transaldolase/phosoglucose isomerase [Pyrinomonadaceae bacterium]|nr:bifunctional transaldolase/phosoglucose isomerase [Pyrinomonadaceae bacterium]